MSLFNWNNTAHTTEEVRDIKSLERTKTFTCDTGGITSGYLWTSLDDAARACGVVGVFVPGTADDCDNENVDDADEGMAGSETRRLRGAETGSEDLL